MALLRRLLTICRSKGASTNALTGAGGHSTVTRPPASSASLLAWATTRSSSRATSQLLSLVDPPGPASILLSNMSWSSCRRNITSTASHSIRPIFLRGTQLEQGGACSRGEVACPSTLSQPKTALPASVTSIVPERGHGRARVGIRPHVRSVGLSESWALLGGRRAFPRWPLDWRTKPTLQVPARESRGGQDWRCTGAGTQTSEERLAWWRR